MNWTEFAKAGVATIVGGMVGDTVQSFLTDKIKPEGDFAAKAVKYGSQFVVGGAAYLLVDAVMKKV